MCRRCNETPGKKTFFEFRTSASKTEEEQSKQRETEKIVIMRSECIFFCPVRVRYGEVDQQGIVYNGNYVVYTDLAFEEFFRSKGYPYRVLAEQYGSEVCHKKSTYEFVSSAYEGDLLEVGISDIKVGNRSITITFEIYREGEDDLILRCESVYVGYDKEKRVSRPITDLMRRLLEVS